MKTSPIAFCALLLSALAVPLCAAVHVGAAIPLDPSHRATVDVGFFYDDLAPYGHWLETPRFGWAWAPTVDATWRPYAVGQWVPSDSGWTWLSDEPFGWATYHYGRWYLDPVWGWMWIPGDEWAPAWVSWRASEDAIGWAPLPPSYVFRPERSLQVIDVGLPPEAYVFVLERDLLRPRVVNFVLPPGQARHFFRSTRNFTRYRRFNHLIINEGVPFERIQRRFGRPVPRYRLVDVRPDRWRRPVLLTDNRLGLFRPAIRTGVVAPPPARRLARRSVMTVADAVRTRRVARAAQVAARAPVRIVETRRPERARFRGSAPRLPEFRPNRGRRLEPRQQAVRPTRAVRQGLGRKVEVRRQGARLRHEVRQSSKAELHRHGQLSHAASSRETRVRQRQLTRSGPRVSARSRSHSSSRHAFRQRHARPQHRVQPHRQGGSRNAMGQRGGRQSGHPSGARRGRGH